MLPVYFPFTSVSRRFMAAASGFFKKIAVYQVSASSIPERMKAWQDDKRLTIRIPLQRHEREINAILREFRNWAEHHQGGDMSIFKTQGGEIPFFDDSSVAQIRKDIKAGGRAANADAENGHVDLLPGVFLQMAQDLDERNREIAGNLKSQAMQQHELMIALKGEAMLEIPGGSGAEAVPEDREAYMVPERMAAWARIVLADDPPLPMLITSLSTVLEDLVERINPGARELQHIQTIAAPAGDAGDISQFRDALAAFIEDIGASAWHPENKRPHFDWDRDACVSGARLSIYLLPGVAPRTLVARYLATGGADVCGGKAAGVAIGNTVVGLVEG